MSYEENRISDQIDEGGLREQEQLFLSGISGHLGIGDDVQSTPLLATNSNGEEIAKINSIYFKLTLQEKNKFLSILIKWCGDEIEKLNCS